MCTGTMPLSSFHLPPTNEEKTFAHCQPMNRREYRTRQNSVTRTYPVYAISSAEFSDDNDSVAEMRSVDPYGYRRRRPLVINRSDRIIAPVFTGKSEANFNENRHMFCELVHVDDRRDPRFRRRPRRARKTATVQTDDAVDRIPSPTGVGSRSWVSDGSVDYIKNDRILGLSLEHLLRFRENKPVDPNIDAFVCVHSFWPRFSCSYRYSCLSSHSTFS